VVTITGANFTGATAVKFGATAATTFTVNTATQITATAPAGSAGTVDVTVTTAGGTSATSAADQYTYAAAPTVTAISPTAGPTAGGTVVTITGTNFTGATAVKFGATAATTFTVNTATQITVTAPAGSAGVVDVTVTTAGGTSATSAADQYTYVAAPTVTAISPTSGPTAGGTVVTVTGTNFTGATAVKFGATAATTFTVNTATQITVTAPAGSAGVVDVTVTTAGGTSATSAADQYTYIAAPTVTAVSPNAGPLAGGTVVTITGTNFTGATAVKFGATPASSFTVNTATQITATAPAGSAGTVDVTVTTTGGTSATGAADQYTYAAPPTVTAISPTSGPTAGGATVTVTGTNFTGATAVKFGATAATTFTVNTATQITVTSPAGSAGTVDVTVTTAGGTSATSAADQYTYAAPPTISKAFGVANIAQNGTTTLTFTITNPGTNTTAANGIAFSDTLTNGLQVASTPGVTNSCGGAVTTGSTSISLAGGSIATPGATCTIGVNVTPTTAGTVTNTTGAVSSTNGGTGATSNTATLNVVGYNIVRTGGGSFPAATFNVGYPAGNTFTANCTGCTGTIHWAFQSGAQPPGINLTIVAASLSGIPSATGQFTMIVTATDTGTGISGSASFPFTILPDVGVSIPTNATGQSYSNLVNNTQAYVIGGSMTAPATPAVQLSGTIVSGDKPAGGVTIDASGVGTFATTQGGSVVIAADGTFKYTPPLTKITSDTFNYIATSNTGTVPSIPQYAASTAAATNTGTITLNLSNRVWYVNNAAGGGNGQSQSPFNSLLSFSNSARITPDAANDIIFVYNGNGTTTNYNNGVSLLSGEQLWGEGVALVVNGNTLVTAGTKPQITNINAATDIVVLNDGNTVKGLTITGATRDGIAGASHAGFTADTLTIQNNTASGLHLTSMTGTVTVTNTTLSGNATGLDINNGTAAISLDNTNTVTANAGQRQVSIQNRPAAAGTIDIGATINDSAVGSTGILVNNSASGTINFSGNQTLRTTTNTAVNLTSNTGTTISFTGTLGITTTSGTGFSATGGGTVTSTNAASTLSTLTGTALLVSNTTIGATNLEFNSISANGGSNGIFLNNTGASGGLHVTGNVASTTNDGSGGTLQNMTGPDATPNETATVGAGVYLNATSNVSLNHMNLHDFSNYAVVGTGVTGFTMTYTTVNGTNGTSQGGTGEGDVYFTGLSGSATVDHSNFSGGIYDTFHVFNNGSQTLNRITITNSSFATITGATNLSNDALVFQGTGGTLNVTVQNSSFTSARGDLFQMDLHGTMSSDLVFTGNTLTNNNGNIVSGGGGITLGGGGASDNVTYTFNVSNNTLRDALGSAIAVGLGTGTHTTTGTISGNTIGVAATANSGSAQGSGIGYTHNGGTGVSTVTITNNTVYQYNNSGIGLNFGAIGTSNTARLNATVTGNTVSNPGTFASNGFLLTAGTSLSPLDTGVACLTLGGSGATANILAGSGANGQTDMRIRDRFNVKVGLPGYSSTTLDTAGVITFLQNNNTGTASVPAPASGTTNGTTNGFFGPACP